MRPAKPRDARSALPSTSAVHFSWPTTSATPSGASRRRSGDADFRAAALDAKMLGKLQALRLIVRADALAVHRIGPRQHFLVHEPADDLPELENERHFARAHFQYRARPLAAGAGITEAGIEEARIVHAEITAQGIARHHLGGVIRRHLLRFLCGLDVDLAVVEYEAAVGSRRNRLPDVIYRISASSVNIDQA